MVIIRNSEGRGGPHLPLPFPTRTRSRKPGFLTSQSQARCFPRKRRQTPPSSFLQKRTGTQTPPGRISWALQVEAGNGRFSAPPAGEFQGLKNCLSVPAAWPPAPASSCSLSRVAPRSSSRRDRRDPERSQRPCEVAATAMSKNKGKGGKIDVKK
ncbi:uncharacterized protein LOC100412981 [Callithrix jacchus]